MSSHDPPQYHQYRGPSSGFHDRIGGIRDDGDVSVPFSGDQALPDVRIQRLPPLPSVLSIHPNSPDWKRLITSPLPRDERISLITTIFSNRDEVKIIRHLCGDNAQILVDVIYEALEDLDSVPRARCLRFLCKICSHQALLPRSLTISVSWDGTKDPPCNGGFADVWKGRSHEREVAIKVPKLYQSNYKQIRKRFCKEVVMWSTLRHPNVLSLLGVMMTDASFAMVSEWMANGNINEFVRAHPSADRLELLADVVKGLIYLHGREMVHGDLKGANILIDHDSRARIADFGLAKIISDQANFISSISHLGGGTAQWMSPELLNPEMFGLKDSCPTKESDIYALGMAIYEVLSRQAPFPRCIDAVVILKVMEGKRPLRPEGARGAWFRGGLWDTLELCWKSQRDDRPNLQTILQRLEGVAPPSRSHSPTPTVDEDAGTETDDTSGSIATDLDTMVKPGGDQLLVPPRNVPCSVVRGNEVREDGQQPMIPITPTHQLSTSAPPRWIAHWDGSSLQEMSQELNSALAAQGHRVDGLNGRDINPHLYVNSLDQIIDLLALDSGLRMRSIRALKKTCVLYWLLPDSYVFASALNKPGLRPSASGEFSDVWKLTDEGGQVFAAKSLRTRQYVPTEGLYKKLCAEVILGKHMKHPNILSIEGVAPQLFEFCTVSEWMVNGNILQYITRYPRVDHLELLIGVTRGLNHLHKNGVVHKNLRGTNILIDKNGNPRLHVCNNRGHMSRYWAPEHHFCKPGVEKEKMTTKSDVYSLSMIIVGIVTRNVPFPEFTDPNVAILVSEGKRPPKPLYFEAPGLTPEVWKIAEMCWHEKPAERPEVHTVLQYLEDLANPGEPKADHS